MAFTNIPMQVKRGHSTQWLATDYPLRSGQIGYETDTGKLKVGNGLLPWTQLPYFIDEDGIAAMIASAGVGNLDPRIGDLSDLSTVAKTTVVASINEVNNPPVPLLALYNNAKAGV